MFAMYPSEVERKIKSLKRKICCKIQFYDTEAAFPEEGVVGSLYISKSDGGIFIYADGEYISLSGVPLTFPEYPDDIAAANDGIEIGDNYFLSIDNSYNLPHGVLKKRTV